MYIIFYSSLVAIDYIMHYNTDVKVREGPRAR